MSEPLYITTEEIEQYIDPAIITNAAHIGNRGIERLFCKLAHQAVRHNLGLAPKPDPLKCAGLHHTCCAFTDHIYYCLFLQPYHIVWSRIKASVIAELDKTATPA